MRHPESPPISPERRATIPGRLSVRWQPAPAVPLPERIFAMLSPLNLPAAQAVRTDIPSQSETRRRAGTRDASMSDRTVKYVREKLVVIRTGDEGVGFPTGWIPPSTRMRFCGVVE